MTLVFDRETKGPGTHALIVASRDVPFPLASHVSPQHETATDSAFHSAQAVANWLIFKFRHPGAELASVDFLASTPGSEQLGYSPPPASETERIPLQPSTFDSFKPAMERWRERLDLDAGNIAFFYYAGCLFFRRSEKLLAFADGRTILFPSFLDAMRGCRAGRQLHIVDGIPLHVGAGANSLEPWLFEKPTPQKRTGWGVIHGEAGAIRSDSVSEFSGALLQILDQPGGRHWIYVQQIAKRLPQNLIRASGRMVSAEVGPNFRFHYPGLGVGLPDLRDDEDEADTEFDLDDDDGAEATAAARTRAAPAGTAVAEEAGDEFVEPLPKTSKSAPMDLITDPETSGSAPIDLIIDPEEASTPGATEAEALTDLVPDDAEEDRDELGRAGLAIALAHKLHQVWRRANDPPPPGADSRAAFVVHLDAPWGGGKTTFANFLGRVLNPLPDGAHRPARFLAQRFPGRDAGAAFLGDPPADEEAARRLAALRDDARRPWIVIGFNAWQSEHIAPPWWVFYQAIRKGCFDAIRREGDDPWRPRARPAFAARPALAARMSSPPVVGWRKRLTRIKSRLRRQGRRLGRIRTAAERISRCAGLWLREFFWRLTNPKVRSLLLTAGISLALLLLLLWGGLFGVTPARTGVPAAATGTGFLLTSGLGVLLAGLTGATAIWGLAALFTESIVPGTDTLAERLSLGSGDPFARFRAHFARTIARVNRPVMVVIDDLDRCRPEFVVDLVRGIQTLLRSPRVVFVILGDRDWIERAFEAHHAAMKEVDVGPEQSFGARFVEKAIQMSFILPALGPERQRAYLRRVLLGERAAIRKTAPAMTAAEMARLNEAVDRELEDADVDPFDSATLVARVHRAVEVPGEGKPKADVPKAEVAERVNERLAGRVIVSTDFETEVIHQIEPLSPYFPANPRQIKRIVNAITLYNSVAVALQRPGLVPNETFRAQLALWVIIMTEWPKTWRLLASFPELIDLLREPDPRKVVRKPALPLPGSPEATLAALEPILADRNLMSLITGIDATGEPSHPPLDTRHVRTLAELTPLHSRKRRLADETGDSAPVIRNKARPPATRAAKSKRASRAAPPKTPAGAG